MEPVCPDCGSTFDGEDNYCRQCGMYLVATRAVTVRDEVRLPAIRERASLPAPVVKAATAVAAGAALQLGISLAGKYLAGQAARQAGRAIVPRGRNKPRKAREAAPVQARPADPFPDAVAISETLVIRRTMVRRG